MSWSIEEIKLRTLASGDRLSIKTYTIQGKNPGPHVHIQASVHGAELQGNAVILHLMEQLKKVEINGSITFVPLCNPYATNNKTGTYTYGRFNPTTGDNWNRNFIDIIPKMNFDTDAFAKEHLKNDWSVIKSEFKKVLFELYESFKSIKSKDNFISDNLLVNLLLQKISCHADAILDLHTGPTATRYLYSAEYESDMATTLLFDNILIIPNEFGGAMDEASYMPWIHLKNSFDKLGRTITLDIESFTLEFGSEETFCMSSAENDSESILNFLKAKKLINNASSRKTANACKLSDYKTYYAPTGGLVDFHLNPGEKFQKGQLLASFYNIKNIDPKDPIKSCRSKLVASEDGIVINRCPSSSVHEGMELFQVLTNVFQIN